MLWYFGKQILKSRIKKWVNDSYKPLSPSSFNKVWIDDFRYYILLASFVIYSFCGNYGILVVALINIYLVVNTIIHLTKRSSKIISFINKLLVDGNGVHFCNEMKKMSGDEIYLMSVRNWFDAKIKMINVQMIKGIEICQQNRIEGCYYLDKIDQKFSCDDFVNIRSQSIHSNIIFLLHLLAVIVVNSALLLGATRFGMVAGEKFTQNIEDVFYVILQIFSTVGFGDVVTSPFSGKCFFIIMFAQVIATIVLGVAYKDFALNMVVIRFEDMAKKLNTEIDIHKKICVESILTKKMPFNSFEDVQKERHFFSQILFDKLKEYVEQKDDEQKIESVRSQNCPLKVALDFFSNILKC